MTAAIRPARRAGHRLPVTTVPAPDHAVVRPTSAASLRAAKIVATRLPRATTLGARLARLAGDPEAFATACRRGLAALGDAEYLAGQRRVAPGIGSVYGVRSALLTAVRRAFLAGSSDLSSDQLLLVANRLLHEEHQEPRWLAMGILERTVGPDPERSWQLIRLAARQAGDWIAIDTLAHAAGRGILNEPYRWAELEQLAYSPSRWERRLIGSTIATIPFISHRLGRQPEIAARGLSLLANLIGDAQPDVQKALSWAYRSLLRVDPGAVQAALLAEARTAAASGDGHRAWVIRDTVDKLSPETAAALRTALAGVRRHGAAPATSQAARTAAGFGVLPAPASGPEPPLFAR